MSDTERFLIFCGTHEPWIAADEPLKLTRDLTITWIAGGEVENVTKIIGFDLPNGTCRDATFEIIDAVIQRWAETGEPLNERRYEFVELHAGVGVARQFECEVA